MNPSERVSTNGSSSPAIAPKLPSDIAQDAAIKAFERAGGQLKKSKRGHAVLKMRNGRLVSLPSGSLKKGITGTSDQGRRSDGRPILGPSKVKGGVATMSTATYTVVVFEAEDGGYWAEVVELPGCVGQGETLDELKHNVTEAIGVFLEVMEEEGTEPIKDRYSGTLQLAGAA